MADNIHTEFHRMLGRESKEDFLQQRGHVVWLYGLSGSGKSTIANALERKLLQEKFFTKLLDGDNVRSGLNANLGFSDEDRQENIRRIAEVAKLFLENGIVTLTSFITPSKALRAAAQKIIGPENFTEVYVKCSYDACAERDVKGLYAKAKQGNLSQFTGKDSQFEEPDASTFTLDTETLTVEEAVDALYQEIDNKIQKQ